VPQGGGHSRTGLYRNASLVKWPAARPPQGEFIMFGRIVPRPWRFFVALFLVFLVVPGIAAAADSAPKVYVILWFDTEDYLLPASDDAALAVADFLTHEKIRATFKVVGEKARTLERRGRFDVVEALKRHERGYHSSLHSGKPSPAKHLSNSRRS